MKKIILTFIILLSAIQLFAQDGFLPARPGGYALINRSVIYGLKVGANSPWLHFSDPNLKKLPNKFMVTPTAGVFVEIPFHKNLSIAPELNYQQKGGIVAYKYQNLSDITYKLQANYITLRLPIYAYYPLSNTLSPYAFIGPDLGGVVSGKVSIKQPGLEIENASTNLNRSNISLLYAGLVGGVGMCMDVSFDKAIMVIKTELAVNWGLFDTFSRDEHEGTANPLNLHAYNIYGQRYFRGIELNVSFGFVHVDFHPWLR